ncbi:unnamed protein product [Dibothriocephalus latus]|uniref:C2 domain-containing protein n=1 Tax=Dibothriocephalus latus TaxID=60516 RepID=A0A3P7LY04_DIBLA|nr:unnamed protein product [Dibothriocephalus latus]
MIEACNVSPLDNRTPTINARCDVQLKSSEHPGRVINPRPKYRFIPGGAKGKAGSDSPGGVRQTKTETAWPASSTVIWRTHHPVWNETFFFDKIPNRKLKSYVLTFTLHDHPKPAVASERPEVRLGEVRFPLVKIYKQIEAASKDTQTKPKDDNATVKEGEEEGPTQAADDTYENCE